MRHGSNLNKYRCEPLEKEKGGVKLYDKSIKAKIEINKIVAVLKDI